MTNPRETEKYEVLEKIGHGSFGIIRKVRRESDGLILCRKEINYIKMSIKEREQLHAEFSILSSLRHPNIVAYYHREHLKLSQDVHLYMEYCGGGDLSKVIQKLKANDQYAEESFVWSIFTQLVTALYRCHYGVDPPEVGKNILGCGGVAKPQGLRSKTQVMILHRDLKPENVFLGADNSVKLGDFGLSKLMQSHDFASTYVGTPYYMSPEICAAERYTLKSDVWSLGCIMYELCAREPPFKAQTHIQLVQKIRDGRINPLPDIYSLELQHMIRSCLKTNSTLRPETAQLLNLPIVRLMRKECEVVELAKVIRSREELAKIKLQEAEARALNMEAEKARFEASLRREWEVKARLEIDRQIQIETEKLRKKFDFEVRSQVEKAVQARMSALSHDSPASNQSIPVLPPSPPSSLGPAMEIDDDSLIELSSPIRGPSKDQDPFKAPSRPGLLRQKTAPARRQSAQPAVFQPSSRLPGRNPSPNHSSTASGSPVRRGPANLIVTGENGMNKAVTQRNFLGNGGGRTLVELNQAKITAAETEIPAKPAEGKDLNGARQRSDDDEVASWDPEKDDMPSPFLIRGAKGLRRL